VLEIMSRHYCESERPIKKTPKCLLLSWGQLLLAQTHRGHRWGTDSLPADLLACAGHADYHPLSVIAAAFGGIVDKVTGKTCIRITRVGASSAERLSGAF
jgi:hypothetical protein